MLIDTQAELSDARIGGLHRALGVLVTLITVFDGYDTFNPAYVIHYVAGPWGLTPGQSGLLISSGLVGFLIGAAGQGLVADRLGRRGAMIAGLWVVNLFTVLTPLLGQSFPFFCAMRILTGIGLGTLLPLATTFINELAPRRVSNSFSLWGVTLGWSLGGTLAGLIGVFLTPLYGWEVQIMSFVGGLTLAMIADRHSGRSPALLGLWWATGGLAVLVLLVADSHTANFVCVVAAGFFAVGAQHVMNNFTASSYDTQMRASGVGMMLSVGRVGAILGPYVAGLLQGATGGPGAMFCTIGCGGVLAGVAITSLAFSRPAVPDIQPAHS